MHRCRFGRVVPRTNAEFWRIKRESNRRRDKANLREIRRLGWDALVIWECQLKDMNALEKKIRCFLDD
jgi:DNA mismatch endonuclease (patch repair protein)